MKEDFYNESNDVFVEEDSLDLRFTDSQDFDENDVENTFYEEEIDRLSDSFKDENEEGNDSYSTLEEESDGIDMRKLNESRFMNTASMIRFFKTESEIYEFSRSTFTFYNEKDSSVYKGKVMRQMPGDNSPSFIFLIEQKNDDGSIAQKMKKFSVNDISVFI